MSTKPDSDSNVPIPTFSRESDDYTASWHLMKDVLKPNERSITPEMVNEAIEKGKPIDTNRREGDLVVTVRHKWGAMHYEVVLNVEVCEVITACESGRGK